MLNTKNFLRYIVVQIQYSGTTELYRTHDLPFRSDLDDAEKLTQVVLIDRRTNKVIHLISSKDLSLPRLGYYERLLDQLLESAEPIFETIQDLSCSLAYGFIYTMIRTKHHFDYTPKASLKIRTY